MSLQVQIMLVLSGHPNGRATLAEMNADLAILAGADRDGLSASGGWRQMRPALISSPRDTSSAMVPVGKLPM